MKSKICCKKSLIALSLFVSTKESLEPMNKYNKKNNWFEISWEDEEGDNEVNVYSLDEKIHVNSDEWSYGIYKPQTI